MFSFHTFCLIIGQHVSREAVFYVSNLNQTNPLTGTVWRSLIQRDTTYRHARFGGFIRIFTVAFILFSAYSGHLT